MDRRFLTVLGVSLVFALVVSSVFYQMTAHSGSSAKSDVTNQKDVVVATRPLGVGVMVRASDVKVVKIAADGFPKGAFSKVEDVLERPVVSNVLLDEPILEGRLATRGSGLGLAPTIPVGMRAVSVRVNDVAGIAGFVIPGMHVDVLVTGKLPSNDGDMTSTCLQNILVLSAGAIMQPDARGAAMPIGLFIGYFATQRTGQTIHSPQHCLPGAGWTFEPKYAGIRVIAHARPPSVSLLTRTGIARAARAAVRS